MFFLDGDKAHVRSGDGFAEGGGILRVGLAAFATHAVGGDELRRHQVDCVAVHPKQTCLVVCCLRRLPCPGASVGDEWQ